MFHGICGLDIICAEAAEGFHMILRMFRVLYLYVFLLMWFEVFSLQNYNIFCTYKHLVHLLLHEDKVVTKLKGKFDKNVNVFYCTQVSIRMFSARFSG